MGSVLPMVMQTAIDLGIFDIIAKAGPDTKLSAFNIAAQISSCQNPDAPMMLDRILRLLASHCVLGCSLSSNAQGTHQRLYHLNYVSKYFVKNEDGVSLGPFMTSNQDRVYMESWPLLKDAILEGGIPFNKVHGTMPLIILAVTPGVNHVEGDMFESVPQGDAIFMKWILHDWSDEHCLKLLKNCYEAIPDDGKVIVVDAVLPVMQRIVQQLGTLHLWTCL
ncbi:hypothetical protein GH714_043537 [Hevea brasiliensis]|uniref:O-methyltransferase domain-containing protein n=1 Tax=Hevea brasiliensis TaxID=3981 RepID=A0A6A6K444_HEVBR|nr:hypothetical protein GH714_043537 [Hevea brasiliensis]